MTVYIENETKEFDFDFQKVINDCVEETLDHVDFPYESQINVMITDEDTIKEINKEQRNIDSATDVLSFPMLEFPKPLDFDGIDEDIIAYDMDSEEVVLGDIYIGENKVIYDNEELVLEHDYKAVSISYFLPIYENLNNITYEYTVEGRDSDWTYIDSRNTLNIKGLNPGKYTLKIRARDGNGSLTKETPINIRVKNPIWKTPLAYLTYIIILSAVSFYILNYVKKY